RLIESASIEKERELEAKQSGSAADMPEITPLNPEPELPPTPMPQMQQAVIMPPSQQPAATQPQPQQQLTSDETIYTNAPVKTVVQQLQQAAATQRPVPQQPVAPLPPQPQQTQVAPQQPQPPQYPQRRQAPVRENIPLSSIEQHPDQYLRRRDGPTVPPRS
ncbi:MAG TPA: hypothetical protein VFS14_00695, partial [Candidatus Saccharimonadales bacterium]|nr:hypothetical protein [Candidatus Saccharimonadales bacterium]